MSENVIEFPNRNSDRTGLPVTIEEAEDRLQGVKQFYIDELATNVIEFMANRLMIGGFNVLEDSYHKEFALVIESVRSLMCASAELYHPFQDLAEKLMMDEKGDGVLTIADEVSVKFDDEKKVDVEAATEVSP
jgi:hypothetical protein